MLYSQLSPEKQQEVDTLIAYLDGLLAVPRGITRCQTANLRDRLDVILDRPKAEKIAEVKPCVLVREVDEDDTVA